MSAAAFARALERDAPLAAVALGRSLRAAGLPVTPERSAAFAASARLVDVRDRERLYWAARACFLTAADQGDAFDAVFAELIDGLVDVLDAERGAAAPSAAGARPRPPVAPPPADRRGGDAASAGRGRRAAGAAGPEARVAVAASDLERLTRTRLDELDEDELALVARYVRQLRVATPQRRARRARRASHGEHLDVRATLRGSHRTAGEPVVRRYRRRRERPRPLVALLDVSGSMAPYARAYLLLLEGAARGARAEVFVFATRLTRVTRALRAGRPHAALERAGAAAPDWAGGTRIGEALRAFNDRWGRRGMARGAVVVIFSDGWERGDPARLASEMERLSRLAHRIVWVNPRVAAPGFQPLTGGMAAALPFVDELVSGHSAATLEAVVAAIGRGPR